ncbi:MAG TPA: sugar phosphate isomerase/epimerase family protein [Chloroflexota bacterium]|nr:sugar phosphate isomerase/epimerase family protein [Chloroflexota bacterium]
MKFGMSTLACPSWTLEQVAAAAREYGYDGVELRLLDGEVITPALVRANRDRLRRLFGEGKPDLVALGSSVRVSVARPEERAAQERDLPELIELARELGVPMVRVFGGRFPDGDDEATAVRRAAASLQQYASTAQRAGITLALETHDDFSRSTVVAAALSQVPSSAVGALWDTHHPYRMGENVAEVWANLASRLVHVHIKDARRRADGGWDLVLLGDGEVPCREITRALALRGYHGYVVAEWEKKWHPEILEPDVALPQHLAKLKEWTADLA